ncbi:MAG: hypothetical protein A2041_07455, partial [Bacteroidetes bacterium GWA2_31_9b]
DSVNADFIKTYKYFTDEIKAQDYVSFLLNKNYYLFGPGSSAVISYDYNGEMPEDLVLYSNAFSYDLVETDYESVDDLVEVAGYFYPDFNPDLYISSIIENSITDADTNDIYRISYKYSNVNPVISITSAFEEGFETGLGKFDSTNIIGSKSWYASSYGSDFFAKMSGYQQDNEDWIISNPIVLGADASITLNFTHAIKYLNDQWDQLSVAISSDYDGSDIEGATWDVIDWGDVADTALLGSDYTFYSSGDIDISAYANSTIYIAFKYTSTTTNAATWEIKNVTVTPIVPVYAVTLGKAPIILYEYYQYSGSAWSKLDDVYCLNSEDYAGMGEPGDNNYFSSSIDPQNYLPTFLNAKYPTAGEGVSKIVVYNFFSDADDATLTIADEYTYETGSWVSSYAYVVQNTGKWAVSATTLRWVFDPTETFTMVSPDYQIICDWVAINEDAVYLPYSNTEIYYGASAYYENFDIRTGKWNADVFDEWKDAVEEAIGTILLPNKYPAATLQVNGVDMFYQVIFDTYSGSYSTYSMKFQVTKAGPEPEFTLVEGPILL